MLWIDCWFFMDGFVVFSLAVIMADSTWQETNGSAGKRNCSLFSLLSLMPLWYPRYETALGQLGGGGVGDSLFFYPQLYATRPSFHAQQPGVHGCLVSWVCGCIFLYSQLVGVYDYIMTVLTWVVFCCVFAEYDDQETCTWADHELHHSTGMCVCVCMFTCMCVCVCVIYACAYACDWECCRFLLRLVQERYLASLMPLKRDVSPWRVCHHAERYTITHSLHPPSPPHTHTYTHTHTHMQPPPQLKPFNVEQFLKGMEGAGPHLTSGIKGNWAGLYRYMYMTVKSSWCIMCVDLVCLHYLSKLAIHLALLP